MVSFSNSREHHSFFSFAFEFPFPSAPSSPSTSVSSPSPSSSSSPSETSSNASLHLKQRHMRFFIAQRLPLPELPSAAFVPAGLSLQQSVIFVGPTSLKELGFRSLPLQVFEGLRETEQLEQPPPQPHVVAAEKKPQPLRTGRHCRSGRQRAFSLRVGNASLKRLLSGAFAGAVSRTAVAPLETIRTHLMVGSGGFTVGDVFQHIMQNEGWQGLFRGNGVNVIRVAPSKAIELFAYDTIKKGLDKTVWVPSHVRIPTSSIAGASAGVLSTLATYPLELLKTRLTVQRGVYTNLLDAFLKICKEEGPNELYRGLTPSLIGVIPYAATNYFAYDFLKKLYKKATKRDRVGNLPTLLIGSTAGAFASASTFPLEVARKQMQVGALTGRPVYQNLFHALACILEKHGFAGLYRGLGASCIKLIPAAGISFMCYEACKRVLIEEET